MGKRTHYADVNIMVRVYFSDNETDDISDQAMAAIEDDLTLHFGDDSEDFGREIVGGVHEIES